MKFLFRLVLVLLSILYPLLWYVGREHGGFAALAVLMLLLWVARAGFAKTRGERLTALLIAAFFAALLVMRAPLGMYWYPVLVNALMLVLFATSLFSAQSVVERLARLQEPDLPEKAIAYTRRVTQIWCVFFAVNGGIAALLALYASHRAWAVYTGIIAYVLMGMLFAGEWCYRQKILKISPK